MTGPLIDDYSKSNNLQLIVDEYNRYLYRKLPIFIIYVSPYAELYRFSLDSFFTQI